MIKFEDKHIEIGTVSIPLRIVKGKAGRIRMSFVPGQNTLKVESGTGTLGRYEKEFLHSRHQWILKVFKHRQAALQQRDDFLAKVEREIPLLGRETPVQFYEAQLTSFRFNRGKPLDIYAPQRYLEQHRRQLVYFALRKFADNYLPQRLAHWGQKTESEYNALRIKELSSKWGSCSSKRNINLNWQLVYLPESLIDYVIIHELMHLREMNHSPKFWSWVGRFYPDYKRARQDLKDKAWMVGILKKPNAKKSA